MKSVNASNASESVDDQISEILDLVELKNSDWLLVTKQYDFPLEGTILESEESVLDELSNIADLNSISVMAIFKNGHALSKKKIAELKAKVSVNFERPKVIGSFVIVVHDYIDPQYGEGEYLNPWCVSKTRYCKASSHHKLRKFDSYEEAQDYIDRINKKHKKDRYFEIMYVLNLPTSIKWHSVNSTEDALEIDSQL